MDNSNGRKFVFCDTLEGTLIKGDKLKLDDTTVSINKHDNFRIVKLAQCDKKIENGGDDVEQICKNISKYSFLRETRNINNIHYFVIEQKEDEIIILNIDKILKFITPIVISEADRQVIEEVGALIEEDSIEDSKKQTLETKGGNKRKKRTKRKNKKRTKRRKSRRFLP